MTRQYDAFDQEPAAYMHLSPRQKECVESLRGEKERLRRLAGKRQHEINDLKSENEKLKEDKSLLQIEIMSNKAERRGLLDRIETLKAENENLAAENKELDYENSDLLSKLSAELNKKSDKLTVTVNAEHIKSELDDLYQEFKELEGMYDKLYEEHRELQSDNEKLKTLGGKFAVWYTKAVEENDKVKAELKDLNAAFFEVDGKYREKSDALLQIKGHVETLANDYNFKEMPNGGGLHHYHEFRKIADIAGAKIPDAPFVSARIKAPNVLGDLNNAKIKDLDADKITSGTIKAQKIGKKMAEGFEKGIKEAEPSSPNVLDEIWKTLNKAWIEEMDKRIVDTLKQALDIKSPTELAKEVDEALGGEDNGTESDA
ncbi:hypothetical protein PPK15_gp11 [Bacillus phage 000TH010]|uniref:Uncharacterized protein n=1 Tax=Bacillus phage 000TH010 TaxID=2601652 RepID=A0A5P8PHS2_9CAUD|nr:hypothetical protein PPK15_gp11 [Bacillus phage 000TH010]QFR56224.1 hypothetical protein 000TH010_11 [Bacillus phage 000TH010]